ncbi:hypothetical protein PHMEG_00013967 [Phytophthora megakarya]|uniref:Uncharacterized protein n=1 Tax=Phytophthora megakarya TaxID=4795 RepID=A0A225W5H1_9STRA|nr:hypothetical protein PHMEG_00013967 [Phytophthora megakarya]
MNCCCSRIIAAREPNICCMPSACCIHASSTALRLQTLPNKPQRSHSAHPELCFSQYLVTETTDANPVGASSSAPHSTRTHTTRLVTATIAEVTLICALEFASKSRGNRTRCLLYVDMQYGLG